MGAPKLPLMSVEDFFVWQQEQDSLYELVNGAPVKLLKAMTGASQQHDKVVVNLIVSLGTQLKESPCRPTTDDLAVRTKAATIRRPDVTVECGELKRDSHQNHAPKMVVEVLSPSTMGIDRIRKLEEYKELPTLCYILIVDTRMPTASLYSRDASSGWILQDFMGLNTSVNLPEINATLAMSDVFDGLTFNL